MQALSVMLLIARREDESLHYFSLFFSYFLLLSLQQCFRIGTILRVRSHPVSYHEGDATSVCIAWWACLGKCLLRTCVMVHTLCIESLYFYCLRYGLSQAACVYTKFGMNGCGHVQHREPV